MADRTVSVALRAVVAPFVGQMSAASAAVQGFARTAKDAGKSAAEGVSKSTQGMRSSLTDSRQEWQEVGTAATVAGAAITGAMVLSAQAAIDFESSFTGVRKTVNGSEVFFDALANSLREMATELPVTIHELNGIAEAAGRLGVENDAILGFTETVAQLAVTTDLSADQAANAMARFGEIMNAPQDSFDELGSVLVNLGNNLATSESEILTFALRVAGAAEVAGFAEEEVLAISGALSQLGIPAEAGGTAISRAMIDINTAVEQGSSDLAGFAEVAGYTADEFAAKWEAEPADALNDFVLGLTRMQDEGGGATTALEDLGLGELRTRDALLRLIGSQDGFNDSLALSRDAMGDVNYLAEEADLRFGTMASQIDVAKNKVYDAAITIGEQLAPAVVAVADVIGGVATAFSNLPEPLQNLVSIGGAAAGLVLTLAGGFALLAPRIVATKAALSVLSTSMPGTTGAVKGLFSILGGPWGIALAAGTAALGAWAYANGKAQARVDDLTDAIVLDSGAIGENTRRKVANRLETDGVLEAAHRLGLNLADVTDAALGNAEAQDRIAIAMANSRSQIKGMDGEMERIGGAGTQIESDPWQQLAIDLDLVGASVGQVEADLDNSLASYARTEAAADETGTAAEAMGGKFEGSDQHLYNLASQAGRTVGDLDDLEEGFVGVAGETDGATQALQGYLDLQRGISDPAFAAIDAIENEAQAHRDYEQAIRDANEAQRDIGEARDAATRAAEDVTRAEEDLKKVRNDGEATTRDVEDAERALEDAQKASEEATRAITQAERDKRDADREVELSALDVAKAVATAEQAALDGELSFDEFERQLSEWVTQGRITGDEADDIAARVANAREQADLYEGDYYANLYAQTANAESKVRALQSELDRLVGRSWTVSIDANTGGALVDVSPNSTGPGGRFSERARGGPVAGGYSYLVGEQGPEIVRFGTSGYVHTASDSRQMFLESNRAIAETTGKGSINLTINGDASPRQQFEAVQLLRVYA